jgi:PelA/Pel-15E family pectate lyase
LDFILDAQFPNGGWPQFYPDTSGYRKYITFNDGAMIGVMKVLQQIVQKKPWFSFVDADRRDRIRKAFDRGVACILKCQIKEKGKLTVWCQQHDNADMQPQRARTFEPASLCSQESAEIVTFLMSLDQPTPEVHAAVKGAVEWFHTSMIKGVVVRTVDASPATYQYHSSDVDRVVQNDPDAPGIWARFYELGTGRPLFCNRDGRPVYSLAEVDRERRTGYAWYGYAPDQVLRQFTEWEKKWVR